MLNGQQVYTIVEQMSQYPGGKDALMRFLSQHTIYPILKEGEQALSKVIVTFIIDADGKVINECICKPSSSKSLHPLEQETLKIARLLPDWKPGKQKGKRVPVRYYLPIIYELDDD